MGCCLSPQRRESDADVGADQGGADDLPRIGFPDAFKGKEVSINDATLTISGKGSALASAPIEQDAAYWEVRGAAVLSLPTIVHVYGALSIHFVCTVLPPHHI